jgi:hypothetical protein
VLQAAGRRVAVIEVKVLSGLGFRQLDRYAEAVPGADRYIVVFPERLTVDVSAQPRWRPLTWEAILRRYSLSPSGCSARL